MTSKSTSIGDLPTMEPNNEISNDEETMMVNSILKEIENADDIDNSEHAINYTIDTSQIPPKINEEIPTKEMIQETAKEIFNRPLQMEVAPQIPMVNEEPILEVNKKEINSLLNNEPENNKNIESLTNKLINKGKYASIILVLVIIFNIPQFNKMILKFLPKMAVEGPQVSIFGTVLKAFLIALIYFGLSFII